MSVLDGINERGVAVGRFAVRPASFADEEFHNVCPPMQCRLLQRDDSRKVFVIQLVRRGLVGCFDGGEIAFFALSRQPRCAEPIHFASLGHGSRGGGQRAMSSTLHPRMPRRVRRVCGVRRRRFSRALIRPRFVLCRQRKCSRLPLLSAGEC